MKTSLTKLKSSLVLFSLISASSWAADAAKPVAQVTEISGTVFVITPEGKTQTLKVNDHIAVKSEVMVDEGASITMNDYYDATYHLASGSHVKFFDKSMQLKRGKSWIQAQGSRFPLALTTANGHADFWKGEFITTFDQATSRTQVLVVNGDVDVSNVLDKNLKYTVSGGSFTLIDPAVENGSPRAPTKVGLASLNAALAEFGKLPEKITAPANPSRGVASVEEKSIKKGKIIFISSSRAPASVSGSAHAYYKQKIPSQKTTLTTAPIRFFGVTTHQKTPETQRTPAAVAPAAIARKSGQGLKIDPEFGDSLKTQVMEQPKHTKELDHLIEELESY